MKCYAHEIIPVFNDSILQEYEEVLSRKKRPMIHS